MKIFFLSANRHYISVLRFQKAIFKLVSLAPSIRKEVTNE